MPVTDKPQLRKIIETEDIRKYEQFKTNIMRTTKPQWQCTTQGLKNTREVRNEIIITPSSNCIWMKKCQRVK